MKKALVIILSLMLLVSCAKKPVSSSAPAMPDIQVVLQASSSTSAAPASSKAASQSSTAAAQTDSSAQKSNFLQFIEKSHIPFYIYWPIESPSEILNTYQGMEIALYFVYNYNIENGIEMPKDESGMEYISFEEYTAASVEAFGAKQSPEVAAQNFGASLPGYIRMPGGHGLPETRILEDTVQQKDGIFTLIAEHGNWMDSPDSIPAEDRMLYTFKFMPENTYCPYQLVSAVDIGLE